MKIAKTFTFDAAHRLQNHDGKCKNLHGHTYQVEVVIEGEVNEHEDSSSFGMVLDFSELKKAFQEEVHDYLDHSSIFEVGDPLADAVIAYTRKVVTFNFPPTAENLAVWIKEEVSNALSNLGLGQRNRFFVRSVRVWETPTSWAEA